MQPPASTRSKLANQQAMLDKFKENETGYFNKPTNSGNEDDEDLPEYHVDKHNAAHRTSHHPLNKGNHPSSSSLEDSKDGSGVNDDHDSVNTRELYETIRTPQERHPHSSAARAMKPLGTIITGPRTSSSAATDKNNDSEFCYVSNLTDPPSLAQTEEVVKRVTNPAELCRIRIVVNDVIFPHIKIIPNETWLQESGKMAQKTMTALGIADNRKATWWRNHYIEVKKMVNTRRNNMNSEMKRAFLSKLS